MKYFYLFAIFFILLFIWQLIKFIILRRFFHTYVLKKALLLYSLSDKGSIFSSYIWLKAANLYSGFSRNRREKFVHLIENKQYEQIVNFIAGKNLGLAHAFSYCVGIKKSKLNLQRFIKNNSNNVDVLIILALIYDKDFAFNKLQKILNKLKSIKLNKSEKFVVYNLEAKTYMFDTDMFSASCKAFKAMRAFKKNGWFYEEAEAYVLLGEMYRISAMYDVSQVMFDAAQKIYSVIGNIIKVADVKTLKAILLMGQERFAEAEECFCESKKVFEKNKLNKKYAEVLNQQALMLVMQKKYTQASKTAKISLEIHKKIKNIRGQSFSLELISLSEYKQAHYKKAIDFAVAAMTLYLKSGNYAAYEDSAFLAAQSYFALKRYKQSERFCRKIIDNHDKNNTCFHIANVYSLLGLIYVKLNDFSRASAWFKKSLSLEQYNERYSAAATDYVNLAMIDKKIGNLNSALYNFQAALDSAKKQNDENLCAIIEQQIKKIDQF